MSLIKNGYTSKINKIILNKLFYFFKTNIHQFTGTQWANICV